jgi:hypothetical protein
MPRYRVVWPDVPREHRASYSVRVQQQFDQRIGELLEDPRARARFTQGLGVIFGALPSARTMRAQSSIRSGKSPYLRRVSAGCPIWGDL